MISELLREGKENAIRGRELARRLRIDIREVTAQVERERRQGRPICASQGEKPGYYMAATKAEMRQYCQSLKRRSDNIQETRKACIDTIDALPDGRIKE